MPLVAVLLGAGFAEKSGESRSSEPARQRAERLWQEIDSIDLKLAMFDDFNALNVLQREQVDALAFEQFLLVGIERLAVQPDPVAWTSDRRSARTEQVLSKLLGTAFSPIFGRSPKTPPDTSDGVKAIAVWGRVAACVAVFKMAKVIQPERQLGDSRRDLSRDAKGEHPELGLKVLWGESQVGDALNDGVEALRLAYSLQEAASDGCKALPFGEATQSVRGLNTAVRVMKADITNLNSQTVATAMRGVETPQVSGCDRG